MISNNIPQASRLRIGAEQIKLLEQLCTASAVSGDEGEVRKIILKQVKSHADEVKVDALGNILVTRYSLDENPPTNGEARRLRVMLSAHMDEVGLILTHSEGEGFFSFEVVGGIDERQLVGKVVKVGQAHIPGVIGAKPVHLTTPEERRKKLSIESLRIDVGVDNQSKVKVGDRATFSTGLKRIGSSLYAKALDNRMGVATLIELIKHSPPQNDLLAAFTVQEEVGLRGARVAAYGFNPDLAIVIDVTPAYDLPLWDGGNVSSAENTQYNTHLDSGPAIYLADRGTISDPRLVRYLVTIADRFSIPYQFRQPGGGGTDAGSIHLSRGGIPSISVSVPGRYLHCASSLARISDWENTLRLMHAAISQLSFSAL